MSTASVSAVPDTQLGLTSDEVLLLRQVQNQAAAAGSTSSRAASRASSHGLLFVDSTSLSMLGRHLDRIMTNLQSELTRLSMEANDSIQAMNEDANSGIDITDAEMERNERINAELDEVEMEFDRISNIKEIVAGYRERAEQLERDLDRSQGSTASRRDGHSSSRHRHSRAITRLIGIVTRVVSDNEVVRVEWKGSSQLCLRTRQVRPVTATILCGNTTAKEEDLFLQLMYDHQCRSGRRAVFRSGNDPVEKILVVSRPVMLDLRESFSADPDQETSRTSALVQLFAWDRNRTA